MKHLSPEWNCPKSNCNAVNPVSAFKCTSCGFNAFIDAILRNALWLTLFKFALDVFLINVLNADKASEFSETSVIVSAIFLLFFGIINTVHITIKFNKNLNYKESFIIGITTALTIIIFYVFVVNAYNMVMGLAISNFEYKFEISSNVLIPLILCTLGGLIGGIYSQKMFKPAQLPSLSGQSVE